MRQATVTLKHWIAYSIENYKGVTNPKSNPNPNPNPLLNYKGVTRHNVDVKAREFELANRTLTLTLTPTLTLAQLIN